MRVVAFLTDPPTVATILRHVGLPPHPPPLAPARAPPQAELAFDQTAAFDPSDGEDGPDFEFDQSGPDLEP